MKSLKKFLSITLFIGILAGFFIRPASAATTITIVDGNTGLADASLELNASGFPVISYYDAFNTDLKVAVCGNATCTSSTTTIVDSSGWVGQYTSLELNTNGFPVISYYDYTNTALKVAVCGNTTCTNSTITTVDNAGNVGWYNSLALNSSGFPLISYYDYTNSALKVAVCGNATCTTSTITTVDNSGSVGWYTSLALNASGFPVISYYDITNTALKVAVCGNAACTTSTTTTVDNAGDVGSTPSLALNAKNNPVISYLDSTNGDLKLAVCGNATCTTSTITTVDSSGFLGTASSLALNTSGNPVISYNNYFGGGGGSGNLKVAICGNTNCTAQTTFIDVGSGTYGSLALNTSDFPIIGFHSTANGDLRLTVITPPFVIGTATPQPTATSPTLNLAPASSIPKTGFAPNRITSLISQPANLTYSKLGNIWLELPSLNVKTNIVGVPQVNNTWDVSWLGNDVGWLNNTAFPTWEGNSVVTAHVTDNNGLPGPFANLKQLQYGDKIIVHLSGQQYVFEVRSSSLMRPFATKYAFEHLESHSYLTLITCQGYDEQSDSYRFRRIIRAVLVEVQ